MGCCSRQYDPSTPTKRREWGIGEEGELVGQLTRCAQRQTTSDKDCHPTLSAHAGEHAQRREEREEMNMCQLLESWCSAQNQMATEAGFMAA